MPWFQSPPTSNGTKWVIKPIGFGKGETRKVAASSGFTKNGKHSFRILEALPCY
jgi:hypothetical protein